MKDQKNQQRKKTVTVEYQSYLATFCDDMGLEWELEAPMNKAANFVKITFRKGQTHSEIFQFAVDFCQWRESLRRINNQAGD